MRSPVWEICIKSMGSVANCVKSSIVKLGKLKKKKFWVIFLVVDLWEAFTSVTQI